MNANVSKLLNEQINKEFYSAYLYLDFANYYAAVGLDGFENWYRVQAQEERDHAMLFYQYLQNNGEGVTFEAIAKPEWERGDHMTPLKKALEHEKLVTASINAIYAAAYEVKDFRTMQMLDWFIKSHKCTGRRRCFYRWRKRPCRRYETCCWKRGSRKRYRQCKRTQQSCGWRYVRIKPAKWRQICNERCWSCGKRQHILSRVHHR